MATVTTIASGGGKKWGAEVEGVKAIQLRVKDLIEALSPDAIGEAAAKDLRKAINDVMAEAAGILKSTFVRLATGQKWPKAVIAAAFTYADAAKGPRHQRAALAGVRTGAPPRHDPKIYREWNPGKSKSARAKVKVGERKIGMSLASMYEYGTSKMRARPAWRPAITASRGPILAKLKNGYGQAIEEWTRRRAA